MGGRPVGPLHSPYLIAEAGVNHNGDAGIARQLIDAAKAAGADAVKFQIFSADRLVTAEAPCCDYQKAHVSGAEAQREMLARLELRHEDFRGLKGHADRVGIDFLATPFGVPELEFLATLHPPAIKIASPDIVNRSLLGAVARTGLPIILSTGAAELMEIEYAVRLLRAQGASFALLHCVSSYPTPLSEARLACIRSLAEQFAVVSGFSDHTDDAAISAQAVGAGACILEKHLTLDRKADGPDHFFSLEPEAFAAYVSAARQAHRSMGNPKIGPGPGEMEIRRRARGRVVAAQAIPAGARITAEHLALKRAEDGLSADQWDNILGRVARADISPDTPLAWSMMN